MSISKRAFCIANALALFSTVAAADPARITIVVPYPAGGMSDAVARMTGKALAQSLNLPVIVENKPGANGVLGLQAIAQAAPDGGTIGFVPASLMTVNPLLYKDMRVDTVKDLTMLTLAVTLPNVLVVNPAVPAKTVDELVAYLKKSGSTVSYGSMGSGSSGHLNAELLQQSAGTHVPHVPYRGSAPAMQDLVAGNIQMAFENLPVALPLIKAGRLRAIGVTSTAPSPQAPEIPPISRSIPGFEDNIWFGFVAPAGLPQPFADKLQAHLVRAIQSEDISNALRERGATPLTSTPDGMRKVVVQDLEKWRALVKARQIAVD